MGSGLTGPKATPPEAANALNANGGTFMSKNDPAALSTTMIEDSELNFILDGTGTQTFYLEQQPQTHEVELKKRSATPAENS